MSQAFYWEEKTAHPSIKLTDNINIFTPLSCLQWAENMTGKPVKWLYRWAPKPVNVPLPERESSWGDIMCIKNCMIFNQSELWVTIWKSYRVGGKCRSRSSPKCVNKSETSSEKFISACNWRFLADEKNDRNIERVSESFWNALCGGRKVNVYRFEFMAGLCFVPFKGCSQAHHFMVIRHLEKN